MKLSAVLALSLSLVACSKKDGGGGSGGGSTPGVAAFTPWVQPDAAKLWEGSWFGRMSGLQSNKTGSESMAGRPVAIQVAGSKATVFDGKDDLAMPFSLRAPCIARFSEVITEGSMKGGTAHHDMIFVVKNGALVVGSGAAGYRKGKTAVVCAEGFSGGVTIADEKGCTTWAEKFDKWESASATCAWSQEDGKDVLTIGSGDWPTKVIADGDVLESDQFTRWVKEGLHVPAKDFADAKAQVAAKNKANDPGEKAKAKGGVVGKLDTAASFIASYAADKSLKGKPIEITLQYLNTNTMKSNGKTTYNVVLLDEKGSDLTIPCDLGETAPPDGLTQYDKVVAKGTITEAFGTAAITACTVAKAP